MNTKNAQFFSVLLIPVLVAVPHFGMALICAGLFFLLFVLSQLVLVPLAPVYPKRFERYMRAIVVGFLYAVFAVLVRIIDPGFSESLSYALPMSAFAVLTIIASEPGENLDFAKRMSWTLERAAVCFLCIAFSGFLREFLSSGSLSLSLQEPFMVFTERFAPRIVLFAMPAGLFFIAAAVFAVINRVTSRGSGRREEP